ncbi:MAG: metallophosphoesterase [Nitrososphaeria archaeon]|nr:metallophosphoesterase [Nitrososphaeria archaeon]
MFSLGKTRKLRIFFSSDIHGSDSCFKKLLMVPKVYKANLVIVGGDITGKALIPIISKGNGSFETYFLGEKININSIDKLNSLKEKIRAIGFYPYVTDERGAIELKENMKFAETVFEELIKESLYSWIKMADDILEKMNDTKFFIMPGNDDSYIVDKILLESKYIINPDEKVIEVDQNYKLFSLGVSNITPWHCPRDLSEEDILAKIEALLNGNLGEQLIFNIHVPPYGTHIDLAPKLDDELKPILKPGGEYEMVHVGSISVRKAIEKFQPKISFHGHIHESRGVDRIGSTLVFNPGSEYNIGVLRGVLVEVDEKRVRDYIFTQG